MKNKEIEEILQTLDGIASGDWIQMLPKEAKALLSHIEQLEDKSESLLEDRKQLLNLVKRLENNRDKAENTINELQYNWNSLRECIIKRLDRYDGLVSKEEGIEIETLMWVRDKMNELEGKGK